MVVDANRKYTIATIVELDEFPTNRHFTAEEALEIQQKLIKYKEDLVYAVYAKRERL